MTKSELQEKLSSLIQEVNQDNFSKYYEPFGNLIIQFRDAGGKKFEVDQILSTIYDEFCEGNDWKEEVIDDTANRIHGHAPPLRRISFNE